VGTLVPEGEALTRYRPRSKLWLRSSPSAPRPDRSHFGTLDGYCSGIAHRHHQEGLSDPTADVVVRRVRRGLRRIMDVAPRRQAHPLTVAELVQIVSTIDANTAIGVRDSAVILLGYASAMRPGEVSALDVEDLTAKPG
jgi:integrase